MEKQMSLESMKLAELKKVAEEFAVDIESAKTKAEVLAALAEEGVTSDLINNLKGVERDLVPPPPAFSNAEDFNQDPGSALVKMERMNKSYHVYGYSFSQEHPFVAMAMESAMEILDTQEGFRLATPREVNEYYS
jgi:hypothetical protein